MILTVEPNLSALGVKKNPQVRPITNVTSAATVTTGRISADVCMNLLGFAYSQIDIPNPLSP